MSIHECFCSYLYSDSLSTLMLGLVHSSTLMYTDVCSYMFTYDKKIATVCYGSLMLDCRHAAHARFIV